MISTLMQIDSAYVYTFLRLVAGIIAGGRFQEPLFAPAGLVIGAGVGAYSAVRLLARSMR